MLSCRERVKSPPMVWTLLPVSSGVGDKDDTSEDVESARSRLRPGIFWFARDFGG